MTDVEREDVQRHVDEVRDRLGLPNHGVGMRCRVHVDDDLLYLEGVKER